MTAGSSLFDICHTHRAWPPLTLSSPKHEKYMTRKRYETDDDVIGTVRSHVEDLPKKSCWNRITKCFQRNNYLEDIQTCYIFHREKIVVTSLCLIWKAQNFSVTPRMSNSFRAPASILKNARKRPFLYGRGHNFARDSCFAMNDILYARSISSLSIGVYLMSLRPSVAEQSVRDPSGVGPFFAVFDFSITFG